MNNKEDFLNYYKPFKNHLRRLKLDDAFYVIWSYIQNLQFQNNFPEDIQVIPEYNDLDYIQKSRYCPAWDLELLTKEVLINSSQSIGRETLKKANYFAGALNKLKQIEGEIGTHYINPENVLSELFRISHRQFSWQTRPNNEFITRYYKIFGTDKFKNIIKNKLGLSIQKIYLIGLMLIGTYLKTPAISLPIKIDLEEINSSNINVFLENFSLTDTELKQKLIEDQKLNDQFFYTFGSIRAFPLIRMNYRDNMSLVCPLPTLLFRRVTSGIYYDIVNEIGYDDAFGESFQNYVGEVIIKSNTNKKLGVSPEITYSNPEKKSSDWIVYDENAILFIECKTKRLIFPAKIELNDQNSLMEQLKKLAGMIKQVYKTILDYQNDQYKEFKYDKKKAIFPLIVTLENRYVFGKPLWDKLNIMLIEDLQNENIDIVCIEEMPYSICSIEEFEKMMQIMQKTGINGFMSKKVGDQEKGSRAFTSFMANGEFEGYYKSTEFLFPEDFDKIHLK